MINITEYRYFWEAMKETVAGIRTVMALTVDEEMGRRLQALGRDDLPALFWLPPEADAEGNSTADSLHERNSCVVYVMTKYDPQRSSALEALETTLPIAENLKAVLLRECCGRCGLLNIDPASISTLPETRLYRNLAGWIVGFTAET